MNFTAEKINQHLADSSKLLASLTANMVYDEPSLLKSLIEVSWLDKDPLSQRASRVVSICCCKFPELFHAYSSEVISRLEVLHSEAVIRNYLKIMAEIPVKLKKKDKSILLNLCFDYLSGSFSVAVKIYSMQVLYNLSLENPEIGIELRHIIESDLLTSSPGYRSRGTKILKKLESMNVQ